MASRAWLLLTVIVGTLIPKTRTQECEPPTAVFSPSNQTEIDFLTSNCTTLLRSLRFGVDTTGSFVLHNITNVTGEIEFYANDALTSVEFRDLEYADSLYIMLGARTGALRRIALPKLRSIDSIFLELEGPEPFLDVPVLEYASGFHMIGNWTNVTFNALKEVQNGITISQYHDLLWNYNADKPTMDVSFPVLEKLNGSLELTGSMSSLRVPELTDVTAGGSTLFGSFDIWHVGSPLSLDFPKLESVANATRFRGNISRVDMPSIHSLPHLTAFSENPISLNMTVNQIVGFSTYGSVGDLHFPNLSNFSSISVHAENKFDCGGFKSDIEKTADGPVNDDNFYCYTAITGGFSQGAKLGIGVGVGVGGSVVLGIGLYFLWRWLRKRQVKKEAAQLSHVR